MTVNHIAASRATAQQSPLQTADAQAAAKATPKADQAAKAKPAPASTIVKLSQPQSQAHATKPSAAEPKPSAAVTATPKTTTTPTPAAKPASSATFVAGDGEVKVDVKNSDSAYQNQIYWSSDNFKTRHYIGIDNETGTYSLGTFKPGTQIEFGIDNGSEFFRTGAASTNFDKVDHAQVRKADNSVEVGFEDLAGGGDRDYNDAVIAVYGVPISSVNPADGTASGTPAAGATGRSNDNRSGLGDGTNPGRGTGRVNSPNQGTENPNNTIGAPLQTPVSGQSASHKASQTSTVDGVGTTKATKHEQAAAKDKNATGNRSGLADGTNPGVGSGRENSPNTGTANPSNDPASVSVKTSGATRRV